MVEIKVLVRDTVTEEVYEITVEIDEKIEELKKKISQRLVGKSAGDFFLYHEGVRLSEKQPPKFYGIEENDILVLKSEASYGSKLKESLLADYESVAKAERWLEQNIGLGRIELEKYERVAEDDRIMIFRSEGSRYKLTLSEDGIDDYVALSS